MGGNNEKESKDTMGTKPFTDGKGALTLRDFAVKRPARRMGGLARELHQLADELNRLASTRETPVAREASSKVVGLPAKVSHPSSQ
jgi:hypothetical protein